MKRFMFVLVLSLIVFSVRTSDVLVDSSEVTVAAFEDVGADTGVDQVAYTEVVVYGSQKQASREFRSVEIYRVQSVLEGYPADIDHPPTMWERNERA